MKFRLGINYWPVSSAMYWWRRFDASEVKSDFRRIRAAGFDSLRIFLLWEDFQPLPTHVSRQALNNLAAAADIAAHNDLSLIPTLFTGHMSGVNWIPDWALESWPARSPRFRVVAGGRVVNREIKNWYSDKRIIRAQARLAGEVAAALGKHPALWAYDLGNENSNCVVPPTRAAAAAWLDTMTAAIRAEDSSHPITIGLHMEDLEEDRRLSPRDAGQVCDFLSMHGYPIYAGWARSTTDERLLPFLGLITRWMSGREVLFQELGAPTIARDSATVTSKTSSIPLLAEDAAAQFTGRALDALRDSGMTGAMLWCYGDYTNELWDRPPLDQAIHERSFGLWQSDYSGKPALAEVKKAAGWERIQPAGQLDWIDLSVDDFYKNPRENLRRLYRAYLRICRADSTG
jgi:endo-1,4-beta-mannosidase